MIFYSKKINIQYTQMVEFQVCLNICGRALKKVLEELTQATAVNPAKSGVGHESDHGGLCPHL